MPSHLPTHLRIVLLAGLLWIPLCVASAQDPAQETRSVDSFTEVEFSVPGTLHIRQGDAESIEVQAPERILDRLVTTVEEDALEIRSKSEDDLFDGWFGDDDLDGGVIEVYVTVSRVEAISVAGSGEIVGETPIESGSLALNVAGSGDLNLEVNTTHLDVRVAGSGTSTLRGTTDAINTDTAGSGDIRAAGLKAQTAEVRIAGSGNADLQVAERLDAQILGSGDVQYRGQPEVELSSLGSGKVRPIE